MAENPWAGDLTPMFDDMYDQAEYRYGKAPNAFVAEVLPKLRKPGAKVLCVGDGEGRNGVWCAEQGFDVTSLEPSSVGVEKIRALARERGVELEVICERIPSERIEDASYDAVVLTYVHPPEPKRRELHHASARLLRPGGVLVLEGFTPSQRANDRPSGGPPDVAMLFTEELMREDFADLEIERAEEVVVELAEGEGHVGPADVVRVIARRPA